MTNRHEQNIKLSPEEQLSKVLAKRGWDLALAESCTGGLVGFRVTSVAGSSRYFRGSVVAYDNRVKVRMLGVRQATLRRHGAVSSEAAVEMARGVRDLFSTRVAVAVTGVAGPGSSDGKPMGLVYAAAIAGRRRRWVEGRFKGSRDDIRKLAADMALELLLSLFRDDG